MANKPSGPPKTDDRIGQSTIAYQRPLNIPSGQSRLQTEAQWTPFCSDGYVFIQADNEWICGLIYCVVVHV